MPNNHPTNDPDDSLPRIDRWLMDGFERHFLPRYLRKHFHAFATNSSSLEVLRAEQSTRTALVVYANHPSWWDPMTAIYLRYRLFTEFRMYAPIDAKALAKYRIFQRMGFFGIELQTRRGAAQFLKRSQRIVRTSGASLWLTPEGKFCDPRNLDQPLMPGLSHLAHSIDHENDADPERSLCVWFVPVAIEYAFWEERLPECLAWTGQPTQVAWGQGAHDKQAWDQLLTTRLRDAQRRLATASIAHDAEQFELLLSGKSGSWGLYDIARRMRALVTGTKTQLQHGDKFSAQ